jgi:cell division protein FtsB
VIATIVAVTVVLVALPVRSYLRQQSDVDAARADLAELERENDELAARQERLSDPDEIARIARREYGLVEVGEESYSVLPPTSAGLVMPRAWPFDQIEDAVRAAAAGGG